MNDIVTVRGITARGRHGVLPAERELGQPFVVDVSLGLDTAAAARTDDLTLTVDYAAVAAAVVDAVSGEPVDLIETLAERIAGRLLGFQGVDWVEVCVHKPQAPIHVPFGDVSVTIRRERG